MTKRPSPAKPGVYAQFYAHLWAMLKRNPISVIAGLLTIFVAIPSAYATYNVVIEPILPTWRSWVREHVADTVKPILVTQNAQAVAIDRFLLYQQQDAIAKAKSDPLVSQSPTAQERVQELSNQAKETQVRICKAAPNTPGC